VADPENQKPQILENLDPWTDGLKPGEARCFTNLSRLRQELRIRFVQAGVESSWPLQGPCTHNQGPYGWISDVLLSGYHCHRERNGDLYLYKSSSEAGEINWNWS
jgi:hypothetical protein